MNRQRTCAHCAADFESRQPNAKYCSTSHRVLAARERARQARIRENTVSRGVADALAVELRDAKVEGTAMGQALMVVARRIDAGESGSSLASLVLRLGIELERTVGRAAAALAGGDALEDEVAKARARRDRTRSAR